MNNKGFSIVEILGVMVILGVILAVAITEYTKYTKKASEDAYDMMASSINTAAEEYLMDHPTAKNVSVEDLHEGGYLDSIQDPLKDSDNCTGKVTYNRTISNQKDKIDTINTTINMCCYKYEYTYKMPEGVKQQDKFCKVYPYDITKITNIKVLNVYPTPAYADNVKNWMDSFGKGIINVTPVYIETFNQNPESYLGSDGKWNYDVIVFGFSDCNGSKDLTVDSAKLVDDFLKTGGSAVFGHDTLVIACGGHANFRSLSQHINIENYSPFSWVGSTKVTIRKSGIFTQYPYNIGEEGTVLTIPNTHTSGQIAHGDVWLGFNGITDEDKSVYLTTYGTNAMIQIGHSGGKATEDEQKILTNIIFYSNAKKYVEDEE